MTITLNDQVDDHYNDLIPSKDIVIKDRTTKRELFNEFDDILNAQSLLPKAMGLFCGGLSLSSSGVACVYPYANLNTLELQGFPLQSKDQHTLRIACPKLRSLELKGLGEDGVRFFNDFTLTSFPTDWPLLEKAHLYNCFVT